jgi:hypothetical protein
MRSRESCVVFALVFAARALGAQAGGVALTLRSPREVELARGATTNVLVAVSNGIDAAVSIRPNASLPSGWRILAGGDAFTVARRSRDVWILSLMPAAAPRAGRYTVHLVASISSGGVWRDSVVVVVGRRLATRLRAPNGQQYASVNEEVRLRYRVRNIGNAAATFHISAQSATPGRLNVDRDCIELGLGDSADVTVRVGAPPRATSASVRNVMLVVSADGSPIDSANAEALFVPPEADNTSRRLPIRVTMRTAGRANPLISPLVVESHGAIDESGQWILDLDARGPGPRYSPFGERDRYHLDLRNPAFRLEAGDITPELSRLTEPRWQQLGGLVEAKAAGVSVTAFGARDRYFYSRGSSAGGAIGLPLPGEGRLSFNGMYYMGSTNENGGVGSVSTNFALPMSIRVEGEGATGANDRHPLAGQARVSRRAQYLWFDAQVVHADTSFPGPLHGTEIDALSVGSKLAGPLSVHASSQNYIQFRPVLPFYDSLAFPNGAPGPKARSSERSAGMSLAGFATVDFVRRDGDRESRDDLIRATMVGRLGRLAAVATGEDGRTVSNNASRPDWRGALSLSWSSNPFTASVFGDYTNAATPRVGSIDDRMQRLSSGISLTIRPSNAWRATLFAIGNGSVATGVAWDSTSLYLVDAAIAHDFSGGHSVALHVRSQRSSVKWFADQTLVLFEYGIPLSLRMPFNTGSRVTGRVVDQMSGDPIPNALVRLGDAAAISDRSGRVAFSSLRAGTYPLAVSAGSDNRPGVRAPASLSIDGAHSTTFQATVYPATRTRVIVRRWQRSETPIGGRAADTLVLSDEPPASVMITLVNGADTLRREVINGQLDAGSELYPGMWIAYVQASDMPSGYESRIPATTFQVAPRVEATVTIDLVALQRIPRIIPGGEIKVAPPKPPAPSTLPPAKKPTPRKTPRPAAKGLQRAPADTASTARPTRGAIARRP